MPSAPTPAPVPTGDRTDQFHGPIDVDASGPKAAGESSVEACDDDDRALAGSPAVYQTQPAEAV